MSLLTPVPLPWSLGRRLRDRDLCLFFGSLLFCPPLKCRGFHLFSRVYGVQGTLRTIYVIFTPVWSPTCVGKGPQPHRFLHTSLPWRLQVSTRDKPPSSSQVEHSLSLHVVGTLFPCRHIRFARIPLIPVVFSSFPPVSFMELYCFSCFTLSSSYSFIYYGSSWFSSNYLTLCLPWEVSSFNHYTFISDPPKNSTTSFTVFMFYLLFLPLSFLLSWRL